MSVELALFTLRLLAGIALLAFLLALFILLWRSLTQTDSSPSSYGRLTRTEGESISSGSGQVIYPLRPITTLGRAPRNSVVISDDFASADHARITLRDERWWLEDCDSRNGTALNGQHVERPVILADGDIIGVGRSQFRIELDK